MAALFVAQGIALTTTEEEDSTMRELVSPKWCSITYIHCD
jgi:hypothetical protein